MDNAQMNDTIEYWRSQQLRPDIVFKVTLCRTGAYDYYSGKVVSVVGDWIPTIVSIEIDGDKFWTEAHGRSLTTSTRRYEISGGRCDE